MYHDHGSSNLFTCTTTSKVILPCDRPLNVKDVQNTLKFLFDSLDKKEERWQKMNSTWDIDNIQITHLEHEYGLLPSAYRVIVKFHAIDKPYCVLLKVRNSEVFKANETKANDSIESQHFFMPFIQLHEREVQFYNEIAPWVSIPIPMVYYSQIWDMTSNKEGIIVQEDLVREAVKQDVYNGLTAEQLGYVPA
uniref:SH2 domain-containing protein n=1 Tax=Ascaris lumbricoides TaxID=6252 RepID=A0A0M3INT7_ASCLU